MILLLISFVAGILTVLAPCILPLLPIVVGGSVAGGVNKMRAYTVVISLALSIIAFTLLLKVSSLFIYVPPETWRYISGGILVLFGVVTLFPALWEKLPFVNSMNRGSNRALALGYQKQSFIGDVLVGAALGPVFSSCSPTYFIILASVLPSSFWVGVSYLIAYAVGLSLALLLIALLGQRLVDKLGLASDTHGWFRRALGVLFIIVGVLVFTGWMAQIEATLLEKGFDVTMIEQQLLQIQ